MLQKRSFWAMATVYVAIWLVVVTVAGNILNSYEQVINNALGLKGYRVEANVIEGEDVEYFKSEYVKKYENGKIPLPVDHLITLCKFYNVSADWLLGLKETR